LYHIHSQLTAPKPDFHFGFSIHDPARCNLRGFGKNDYVQNFTIDTLFGLQLKGLHCSPTTGLEKDVIKKKTLKLKAGELVRKHYLLCFPWAVVEMKKHEVNESKATAETAFCYCQAANAASTALAMLENLAQFEVHRQNSEHVPPVVAFTSVGANAKVWLAYSQHTEDNTRDHVCVRFCPINFWKANF
jgi:hypothetical protein